MQRLNFKWNSMYSESTYLKSSDSAMLAWYLSLKTEYFRLLWQLNVDVDPVSGLRALCGC